MVFIAINAPVNGDRRKRDITLDLVTGGSLFVSVFIFLHISYNCLAYQY